MTVIEGILVEYEGMDWSPISSVKVDVDALNSEPLNHFENDCTKPVLSPSTVLLMSVVLPSPECSVFPPSP